MFVKIKALLGHKIGSTVITAADSIVISSILGLEILAIYGNYYQIINALIGVVSVIYTAVTASIGNSIVVSDDERVYSNFETLTFINNNMDFRILYNVYVVSFSTIYENMDGRKNVIS